MRVSGGRILAKRLAALVLVAILCAPSGLAQYKNDQYAKPVPSFPNPIAAYQGRDVPKPNFANSARIDQIMRDGKILLSLNDAITLALEINLDLAIARYNLSIADTDVLRTKAGGTVRGVSTGIVSGTPGGGVGNIGASSGSGAGGTSAGSGGAGAGAGGQVVSTTGVGPAVDNFDPFISTNMSIEHLK